MHLLVLVRCLAPLSGQVTYYYSQLLHNTLTTQTMTYEVVRHLDTSLGVSHQLRVALRRMHNVGSPQTPEDSRNIAEAVYSSIPKEMCTAVLLINLNPGSLLLTLLSDKSY